MSDFEEETIWERILALEEAIPGPVKSIVPNIKYLFTQGKKVSWFVASTAAILVLPLSLEMERQDYLEQMKRQERDILMGSN